MDSRTRMAPSEDSPLPGLVEATWRGPYVADFGPGRPTLAPGETSHITPDLAQSDHWEADEAEVEAAQAHLDQLGAAASDTAAQEAEAAAQEEADRQAAADSLAAEQQAQAEEAARVAQEEADRQAAERSSGGGNH